MAYDNFGRYLVLSGLNFSSTLLIQIILPYLIVSSIGAEGYAEWIFYFSYLTFLNLVDFGVVNNAQLNLLKLYKSSNSEFMIFLDKCRNFLFSSCLIFLLVSITIFLFTHNMTILIISIAILINNFVRFNIIVLRSIEKVEYYFFYAILLNISIIILVMFSSSIGASLVLISLAFLTGQVIIMLASQSHYSHEIDSYMSIESKMILNLKICFKIPKDSLKFWKLTALQTINQNLVILLLGGITTALQLATIGVMRTIANVGVSITSVISSAMTPRVTFLDKGSDENKKIYFKYIFFTSLISIPLLYVLLISVYGEQIMLLWMGDLVVFNDELMFLLLLRMFFIVTGYSIQNYESAIGTPNKALSMELFIVIFSLLGFSISHFIGFDVYDIFMVSFLIPYGLYFSYILTRKMI